MEVLPTANKKCTRERSTADNGKGVGDRVSDGTAQMGAGMWA